MPSLHSPFFSLRGACLTMRGGSGPLCTPRSKSSDLASAPIRGRSAPPTPGVYAGLAAPAPTCRRSARAWQSHARHPGDFPVAGKVTKGAPRAVPFGIPRCVVTALFALAALRSGSRRATFCHKNRPICHFEMVGKSVLFFPLVSSREHSLFSIRGSAGLPPRMLEGLSSRNQYR